MTSTARTLRASAEQPQRFPGGWWRLRGSGTSPWEVYLRDPRGAHEAASDDARFAMPTGSAIRIEWNGDTVRWGVGPDGPAAPWHAAAALLHEPCAELYATLPLARYDRRARRFWGTILGIARWPGGSGLIERLARRRRTTDTAC